MIPQTPVDKDANAARTGDASFVKQLNQRVEEERRRITGDLHDVIGAALVAARMRAHGIASSATDDAVPRHAIARLAMDLDKILADVYAATRGLIQRLRPELLDMSGLSAALSELVRSYKDLGSSCSFSFVQDPGMPKITGELATQGYRLVQEALTNAVKHGHASYVSVLADCDQGQIQLTVCDDGVGFDAQRQSPGIGLSNMRERVASVGGTMEIRSSAEEGTSLLFSLPLDAGIQQP